MAKPKTSGARVAPLTNAKYDNFENHSTGEKFEMDGYVKARSFAEAFRALEEQAEHITGIKDIVKNTALGGDELADWMRAAKNRPFTGSDEQSEVDEQYTGEVLRSFWKSKIDGSFHRMHIERMEGNKFYIDFGRSKKY
jgi:hypothetical protein